MGSIVIARALGRIEGTIGKRDNRQEGTIGRDSLLFRRSITVSKQPAPLPLSLPESGPSSFQELWRNEAIRHEHGFRYGE